MDKKLCDILENTPIEDILGTLSHCVGLPVRLLDAAGDCVLECGGTPGSCAACAEHASEAEACVRLLLEEGRRAAGSGMARVFDCRRGLRRIVFPVFAGEGEVPAYVTVGPFAPDAGRDAPAGAPSARAEDLARLTEYLLGPLTAEGQLALQRSREQASQQQHVRDAIALYEQDLPQDRSGYLYQKEEELLRKVKTCSVGEAKALLNDLLGYVFFSEGGELETVRIHAAELTTLLSRVAMDGGALEEDSYALNQKYLKLITEDQTFEELCRLMQDVVETFTDSMFRKTDRGNLYVRKALRYMASHYMQPLTLPQISETVGLSPNYFSAMFLRVTGSTCRERLNQIRVDESKRLLLKTGYSLTEIALAVGFPDQSAYCRNFRKLVGTTPGKYRGKAV